jgi:lipid-A-disaccharide synthase-like uncharacterized protein
MGGAVFYGRFYVQWIATELKRRSVMPVAFWYMSSCGSLMLLAYAVWSQSPLGALGQNVNIVIYSRNLVHIWRERGRLTAILNLALHMGLVLVAVGALGFVALTWFREYEINRAAPLHEAAATWWWLGVGVVGQALFAARFLIQWIATERRRRSVIPTIFWQLSLAAALLQTATFVQRREWVFAVGMASTILIYARNLWFIRRYPEKLEDAALENG